MVLCGGSPSKLKQVTVLDLHCFWDCRIPTAVPGFGNSHCIIQVKQEEASSGSPQVLGFSLASVTLSEQLLYLGNSIRELA